MTRVFISYSHQDIAFATHLSTDLEGYYDIAIDSRIIVPDVPLLAQIAAYIDASHFFLPIISHASISSQWVQMELALAFSRSLKKGTAVVPIIIDDVILPSSVSHIPYVRFTDTSSMPRYTKELDQLLTLLRRSPVIAGSLVLPIFGVWGDILVDKVHDFAVRINSRGMTSGASGLLYDRPIHITGFRKLNGQVAGSDKSDFTGFVPHTSKMFKVEVNDRPLLPVDPRLMNSDDLGYVEARDGSIELELPKETVERGYIDKLQVVFGRGSIVDLIVSFKFLL